MLRHRVDRPSSKVNGVASLTVDASEPRGAYSDASHASASSQVEDLGMLAALDGYEADSSRLAPAKGQRGNGAEPLDLALSMRSVLRPVRVGSRGSADVARLGSEAPVRPLPLSCDLAVSDGSLQAFDRVFGQAVADMRGLSAACIETAGAADEQMWESQWHRGEGSRSPSTSPFSPLPPRPLSPPRYLPESPAMAARPESQGVALALAGKALSTTDPSQRDAIAQDDEMAEAVQSAVPGGVSPAKSERKARTTLDSEANKVRRADRRSGLAALRAAYQPELKRAAAYVAKQPGMRPRRGEDLTDNRVRSKYVMRFFRAESQLFLDILTRERGPETAERRQRFAPRHKFRPLPRM